MRVLIVGGTGNISASIVQLLLKKGHEVTCYNRGERGILPKDVRHIQGDRKQREAFEGAMQNETFDAAIDMICFNAEDAASSVRAFRGIERFLQCSTVCTYGVDYDWLPVTEDHPIHPISEYGLNKHAADEVYLQAHHDFGFPVTLVKPSTTYGPQMGVNRQIAREFSWLDRIRKGKPVVVCGDGKAVHQFLHIDDAAKGFVGLLGMQASKGQAYNLVNRGFISWEDHHRTVMKILGQEVELVGIPLRDLMAAGVPDIGICNDIFAHNTIYSAEKLFRDVPEFQPTVSLEAGLRQIIELMDTDGRIPDSDQLSWEDRLIEAQRAVGKTELKL
jgi:nucleoside-diphosphate-sugar epimerase